MRRGRGVAAAAVLAVLAAAVAGGGCGVLGGSEADVADPARPGEEVVGAHVVRWTEEDDGQGWTADVAWDEDPVLLTSDAQRDTWVADLPSSADPVAVAGHLAEIDLARAVLVIGSYARCTEHSRVLLATDADGPVLRFDVTADEPRTVCEWSPATVDVWSVPLDATDGRVPSLHGRG